MSIQTRVKSAAVQLLIELPAKRRTFEEMAQKLVVSGQRLEMRLAKAEGTPEQKRTLRHIVGIERWGQRRLWLAVRYGGESADDAFSDAHHAHKPADAATWDELIAEFRATRQETVNLARYLAETNIDQRTRVPHNDLGPLSLRGWLRYLRTHASLEGRRI